MHKRNNKCQFKRSADLDDTRVRATALRPKKMRNITLAMSYRHHGNDHDLERRLEVWNRLQRQALSPDFINLNTLLTMQRQALSPDVINLNTLSNMMQCQAWSPNVISFNILLKMMQRQAWPPNVINQNFTPC